MYDVIIIGAGPAGLTAAIYARRAGKTALLIEKEAFGGQITLSPHVENYPFTRPMSGQELAAVLVDQVMDLGTEVEVDTVTGIEKNPDGSLTVRTEFSAFTGRAVIIATGLKHRRLGVPGEERFIGRGISFCAVCDGAFYKGRTVAVVGGGNTAVQDAIYLSKLAKKVYLVHRRDEFRAEKRVTAGLEGCDNIEPVLSCVPAECLGETALTGLKVRNRVTGEDRVLPVDGIFVAIGQEPNNAAFAGLVELDPAGFIVADESCRTRERAVFVAGDCRTKAVRQLVTAGADGGVAAIAACEYIDSEAVKAG